MKPFDSVLLIAFGGPEKIEDLRPFLKIATAGRRVSSERTIEVAHHYEQIGGHSPLNDLTFLQAENLRQVLKNSGTSLPVYVGMRNWHPFLHETLTEMKDKGHRRTLGIVLSSFQTEASWGRYIQDVTTARVKIGLEAPEVEYLPVWSEHPLFIEAMADRVKNALKFVKKENRSSAPVIFTAHSIPQAMAAVSPYVKQFKSTAQAVIERLAHPRWSIAYQSRSGLSEDTWLEPDICHTLRELAGEGLSEVVVAPIGFLCENVEILYDLDKEARNVAEGLNLRFHLAKPANNHPSFIAMLANLIQDCLRR